MAARGTRLSAFNMASIALGLAFLYLPIAILVIYSFNASRLVTVWGGWSVHWYVGLLDNTQLMNCRRNLSHTCSAGLTSPRALNT